MTATVEAKDAGTSELESKMVRMDGGKIFKGKLPNGTPMVGRSSRCPYTPKPNPLYVWNLDLLRDVYAFFNSSKKVMSLKGWHGSGKSTVVQQYHAALQLPLIPVNGHPRMEIADFIGTYVPDANGGMHWVDGPITLAARRGWSVLVDEWNVIPSGVRTGLNLIMEGHPIVIPETGEIIEPRSTFDANGSVVCPGFRMFLAMNPADSVAGYDGRREGDVANDDRTYKVWVPYMEEAPETELVRAFLEASQVDRTAATALASKMVASANDIRKQFIAISEGEDALPVTMSTRALLSWAEYFLMFRQVHKHGKSPLHFALRRALTNGLEVVVQTAIHEIVKNATGEEWKGRV